MKGRPVLLVEDNPDDEALILRSLKKAGLANEVIVARDGAEAFGYLFGTGAYEGREPLEPVVILLDLKLPKMGGLELLRLVRRDERTRRLPVIIVTESTAKRDIYRSYELGANSYVRKPVEFGEFSEAVRQLGLYWLVLNEPPPTIGEIG